MIIISTCLYDIYICLIFQHMYLEIYIYMCIEFYFYKYIYICLIFQHMYLEVYIYTCVYLEYTYIYILWRFLGANCANIYLDIKVWDVLLMLQEPHPRRLQICLNTCLV